MEPIAFHRLGLEESDNARRQLMEKGLVPVSYQNGRDVVGFALSMSLASTILGEKCYQGAAQTSIKSFISNKERYCANGMAAWRSITIHDRPEFVFMNMKMVESRWHRLQLVCSPRHLRVMADYTGNLLWLTTELDSLSLKLIRQTHNHPIPEIQAQALMLSENRDPLKDEMDRLDRPVIVGHKGTNIKAYLVPLSRQAELEGLGLACHATTLEGVKKSKYDFDPGAYTVVNRATPKAAEASWKPQYLILSPDVDQKVRDWIFSCYNEQEEFAAPVFTTPMCDNPYHVPSMTSVEMASILARLGVLAAEEQSVLGFQIQAKFGGLRPYWLIGSADLATRLTKLPVNGCRNFVQPRQVDSGKGFSWIMDNANWLVDSRQLPEAVSGTCTEKRIYDTLQATFASFSRQNNRNLVILPGQQGVPNGLALTNSQRIADTASELLFWRRNGIGHRIT